MCSSVPCKRKSSCQNLLIKIGLGSLRIDYGNPWSRTMSLTKILAMCLAVYGCFSSRKCLYLDSLSTTTKMVSYHLERGRPEMKSLDTCSHKKSGIANG